MASIRDDAIHLAELDRRVVKAVIEWKPDELAKAIGAYVALKKNLKERLLAQPVVSVDDGGAAEILRKISSGEGLPCDGFIERLEAHADAEGNFGSLDPEDIENLGDALFYSWYSHHDYIAGLNELGSLVLRVSVPETLTRLVDEAKKCYAFEQYNATYGLCRILLEASVRDICFKKQLLPEGADNIVYIEKYKWSELRDKVSFGELRERLKTLYGELSSLIHARKTINREEARQVFAETVQLIQDLYSYHGL